MPTEVSKMKNKMGKEEDRIRRRKILLKFVGSSGRSLDGCIFQLHFEDHF